MGLLPALVLALIAAPVDPPPAEPAVAPSADAGTPAPAEEKKPDKVRAVVHLRDGGLVRGTVKRMRLGKSITLALQSGKSITFDDEDIVSIELFGSAAGPEADKAAAEAQPSVAPAPAPAPPPSSGRGAAVTPSKPSAPAREPDAFAEQSVTAPAPKSSAAKPWPEKAAPPGAPPAAAGARAPLPQPAPAADLDTVYLMDGGLLRGTIESEKPDLVIRLVSGKKRTVAARDVKNIVRKNGAASSDGADSVWLKDGSVLRGAVESDKPDVVIRLVSGKKRTVPSAQVQRIDRARKP